MSPGPGGDAGGRRNDGSHSLLGPRSMSPSSLRGASTPTMREDPAIAGPSHSLARYQTGRTFSAWGPLGPWLMSNSTRWLSSNER
jgi:hypothetical protein